MLVHLNELLEKFLSENEKLEKSRKTHNTVEIENKIHGIKIALGILEECKINNSTYGALRQLSKEQLLEVIRYSETRIKDIDDESKVKIFKLTDFGVDSYYRTIAEAQAELINSIDTESDTLSYKLEPVFVPASEANNYIGRIFI